MPRPEYVHPTNRARASWGYDAVRTHVDTSRSRSEPFDIEISDLLSDLMHLARSEKLDFGQMLERAQMHFNTEVAEEPSGRKDWDPRRG